MRERHGGLGYRSLGIDYAFFPLSSLSNSYTGSKQYPKTNEIKRINKVAIGVVDETKKCTESPTRRDQQQTLQSVRRAIKSKSTTARLQSSSRFLLTT